MQSQTINSKDTSNSQKTTSESEIKLSSTKSPQPNLTKNSQEDQSSHDNSIEPKENSTTQIKSKQESNQTHSTGPAKENNPSKPVESPFTAFCKGLYLSPGPMQGTSSRFWNKSNAFFGNESGNFISPIPINLGLGIDNGPISPIFSSKSFNMNQFGMKTGKEENNLGTEGNTEKDEGDAFDEPLQNSPKFIFPAKKSIYSNANFLPTQQRANEVFSQGFFDSGTKQNQEDEGVDFDNKTKDLVEQGGSQIQGLQNFLDDIVKTPSPKKFEKTFDFPGSTASVNNLFTQRHMSFGPAINQSASSESNTAANSSSRSSDQKMKIDIEEDEGNLHDANLRAKFSDSNKKKICCNCKKSKCLKLYCDCFARGQGCIKDCNCQNCHNNEDNAERKAAMMNTLERNPIAFKPKIDISGSAEKMEVKESSHVRHIKGCNCKKSGCLKKYCECFQAGAKCSEVCKCENCKNIEAGVVNKQSSTLGISSAEFKSSQKPYLKLGIPSSETQEQAEKSNSRTYEKFSNEDDDTNSIFEESDGDEERKKFFHPRKQLFNSSKKAISVQNTEKSPLSFKMKAGEVLGEFPVNKYEVKQKSHEKNKERKRKGSNVSTAPPKTPTNFSDVYEKTFDYTPSPEKATLSIGRTRRNITPFGHLNTDEYELRK